MSLSNEELDKIIDDNNLLGDTEPTSLFETEPQPKLSGQAFLDTLKIGGAEPRKPAQPIQETPKTFFSPSPEKVRFRDKLREGAGIVGSVIDFFKGKADKSIEQKKELALRQDEGEINKLAEFIGKAGVDAEFIATSAFDTIVTGLKGFSSLTEKRSGTEGTGDIIKDKAINSAIDFFNTESGKSVLEIVEAGEGIWNKFAQFNPSLAEIVKGSAKIAELIPASRVDKEAGIVAKEIGEVAQKGVKTGVKAVEEVGETGRQLVRDIRKPGIITKSKEEIDTLVGRITQGTKEEISSAKKALKQLDTTDVESFADLKKLADDSIGEIAKKQDELLGAVDEIHDIEKFTDVVANKERNFVKRAVEQLKEFYEKTEDLDNLQRIEDLELRFKEGISTLDINDLAREYNRTMPNAFSKRTGEPLTSVNKVAVENTRKGLKESSRSVLPDDASKLLDDEMSNLFTLKRTAEKMESTVQKLQNKVKKRGLFEKVARKAGIAIDVATFGTVRGFLTSFMPSNIGNKVLNSLDIESALVKNLKKIEILNGRIDKLSDDNAVSALAGLLKQAMGDS